MKVRKVENIDLTKFDEGIAAMEQGSEHSRTASEKMFFDLFGQLFKEMRSAVDEGKPFIASEMGMNTEIFPAMDIMGSDYCMVSGMLNVFLNCQDEINSAAAALGTRPEICSPQRAPIGWFAKGWYPPPTAIVNCSLDQCDNMCQTGNLMGLLYDVPVFSFNRPYRWYTERGIEFMVGELEDTISFLEEVTGHKMDWDKLREAAKMTLQQIELSLAIHKLVMATPCPVKAGSGFYLHWIRMAFAGRQEGVDYCKTFLDEMKNMVDQGKGYAPKENYRLINLFTAPTGQHDVLEWLEQEAGAVFVAEPMYHRYKEDEVAKVDITKPLEALARFYYLEPYYAYYGPLEEYLDMVVNDAIESKADGAVNWFNSKCRMGGAVARTVKDTLKEKAGIPTVEFGVDILDGTPAVGKSIKKHMEQFLMILDNVKSKVA
ncbi:MAG: 2-hydroxyacyl-CoA dehydratase [Deltaproteobacteria bacterium]|nr:2-hydroxyacyl-CoA dehydratase [Deltaproteobacteria bacterium]